MYRSVAAAILSLLVATGVRAQTPDHLKCYKIKDQRPRVTYSLDLLAGAAGFEDEAGCIVKMPAKTACVQVAKANVLPPPPTGGPVGSRNAARFLCYKVKCPRAVVPDLTLGDQFGVGTIGGWWRASTVCLPEGIPESASEDLTTCDPPVTDRWTFDVQAGQFVGVKVDTVDAATAADLCLFGSCTSGDLFSGDDEVPCTFPSPDFACPVGQFTASADGTCTVEVTACSANCANPTTANYRLSTDGTNLLLVDDDDVF